MKIQFDIDDNALIETDTKKITNISIIFKYENPIAYGYPEVCNWTQAYDCDKKSIENIRRKMNG